MVAQEPPEKRGHIHFCDPIYPQERFQEAQLVSYNTNKKPDLPQQPSIRPRILYSR